MQPLFSIPTRPSGVHDAHDHALDLETPLRDLGDDQVRVVAIGRGDKDVGAGDAGLLQRVQLQRRADGELAPRVLPALALTRVQALVRERVFVQYRDLVPGGERRLGDRRADAPGANDQYEHGRRLDDAKLRN